jgi:hypothetical protein
MSSSGDPQDRLGGTYGVSQRSNDGISCVLRYLPLKRIDGNSEIEIKNEWK